MIPDVLDLAEYRFGRKKTRLRGATLVDGTIDLAPLPDFSVIELRVLAWLESGVWGARSSASRVLQAGAPRTFCNSLVQELALYGEARLSVEGWGHRVCVDVTRDDPTQRLHNDQPTSVDGSGR